MVRRASTENFDAHRAPARPDHPAPGRPARPALARRHAARARSPTRSTTWRPCRFVADVVDPADADRRVHRRRRHAHAGGHARGLPRGPLLPGVLQRDVRQGARGPAERDDAVLPALALRRRQGLRPLHHGQLPRVLRPVSRLAASSSTTSRRAAAWSSSRARSPTRPRSSSACATSCALGNLDAKRDWGFAGDYVEAMWLMLQQDERRRLRDRHRRDAHRARVGARSPSTRPACDWESYVEIDPQFLRPAEVDLLIGDPPRRRRELGWEPKTSFEELIRLMTRAVRKSPAARRFRRPAAVADRRRDCARAVGDYRAQGHRPARARRAPLEDRPARAPQARGRGGPRQRAAAHPDAAPASTASSTRSSTATRVLHGGRRQRRLRPVEHVPLERFRGWRGSSSSRWRRSPAAAGASRRRRRAAPRWCPLDRSGDRPNELRRPHVGRRAGVRRGWRTQFGTGWDGATPSSRVARAHADSVLDEAGRARGRPALARFEGYEPGGWRARPDRHRPRWMLVEIHEEATGPGPGSRRSWGRALHPGPSALAAGPAVPPR